MNSMMISGGMGLNWFAQICFMAGANFGDNHLIEPPFLLVFLFDFARYKENTCN